MKMSTLLEPRAIQFQYIKDHLDDTRFADESINLALDAFDIWCHDRPRLVDHDSEGQTYREWLRFNVPAQWRRCKNVKLAITIFKQLQDESEPEPHPLAGLFTSRRGPSLRQ